MAARLGDQHHKSTCTDVEVSLAVELVLVHKCRVEDVAAKMEVHPRTVRKWIRGDQRTLRSV